MIHMSRTAPCMSHSTSHEPIWSAMFPEDLVHAEHGEVACYQTLFFFRLHSTDQQGCSSGSAHLWPQPVSSSSSKLKALTCQQQQPLNRHASNGCPSVRSGVLQPVGLINDDSLPGNVLEHLPVLAHQLIGGQQHVELELARGTVCRLALGPVCGSVVELVVSDQLPVCCTTIVQDHILQPRSFKHMVKKSSTWLTPKVTGILSDQQMA